LLSGELPIEFGDLIKLDKLIIEDTLIHGPIPSQLGNCLQLSVLSLSQNNLSGPIPGELYNLSKLRSLDLWANQTLSGTISSKIGQLKHLDFLNLSHNNFSGNLPDELGTLSNLDWVGLGDNAFEGVLPSGMTGLNLSVLHFENTSICEPADAGFQAWLDSIDDLSQTGFICSDNAADNDPYVVPPSQACLDGERLLYLEDFQDGKAQGWPEIEYKAQNWEIVADQNGSGNLLVQNPGIIGSMIFYTEKYFGDGVYRIDFMRIGDPQPTFVWHSNTEPFESELGTITDSDYSIGFMHHGAHFVRYTFPVQDTTLLDIPIEVTTDIWHKIEISTFDGLLQVWLDGEKLLAYQDPKPLPEGTISIGLGDSMVEDSMVYYDNLLVCELTAPFVSAYPADQ
jgi:hypothetical protein